MVAIPEDDSSILRELTGLSGEAGRADDHASRTRLVFWQYAIQLAYNLNSRRALVVLALQIEDNVTPNVHGSTGS
jgi:hypothetical protein